MATGMDDDSFSDLYECAIHLDTLENPRLLPCGHSFCLTCLQGSYNAATRKGYHTSNRIRCPTDKTEHDLPSREVADLPVDHKFNKYKTMSERNKLTAQELEKMKLEKKEEEKTRQEQYRSCSICKEEESSKPAIKYCITCKDTFCSMCMKMHEENDEYKEHINLVIGDDVSYIMCKIHKTRYFNKYCLSCQIPICFVCMKTHKGHDLSSFSRRPISQTSDKKLLERLSTLQSSLLSRLKSHKDKVAESKQVFRQLKQDADDQIDSQIALLNEKRQKIHRNIRQNQEGFVNTLAERSRESYCSLSDIKKHMTFLHTTMDPLGIQNNDIVVVHGAASLNKIQSTCSQTEARLALKASEPSIYQIQMEITRMLNDHTKVLTDPTRSDLPRLGTEIEAAIRESSSTRTIGISSLKKPLVTTEASGYSSRENQHDQFLRKQRGQLKRNDEGHTSPDPCAICLNDPVNPKMLSKCKHTFCTVCIETAFEKCGPNCPCCGVLYGNLTGSQPTDGKMTVVRDSYNRLPGYESFSAIRITYSFPDGIQTAGHPNPGQKYTGICRTVYLPDNKEGNEILDLLHQAFKARLVFTIGRSSTTGRDGQITWNGINLKSSPFGVPLALNLGYLYGYPDPTYLQRVRQELADKGITEQKDTKS